MATNDFVCSKKIGQSRKPLLFSSNEKNLSFPHSLSFSIRSTFPSGKTRKERSRIENGMEMKVPKILVGKEK